jgi:hypothetical protein
LLRGGKAPRRASPEPQSDGLDGAQMIRIILHIGHEKTGTSATQHLLAKNAAVLRKYGILYPHHPDNELARRGAITSGNVSLTQKEWFATQVIERVRKETEYESFVFSNEVMLNRQDEFLSQVIGLKSDFRFQLILAVREPLEVLSSTYIQGVKREGYFGSVEEYEPREDHISRCAETIRACERNHVEIGVLNYSALRRNISREIFNLINPDIIKDEALELDVSRTVNRSLSRSELQFLLAVNRVCGPSTGKAISDRLVDELPDMPGDPVAIPFGVYEKLRKRLATAVEFVNRFLNPKDRMRFEFVQSPAHETSLEFSEQQIAVILGALNSRLMTESFRFDPDSYLLKNPDVKEARANPFEHFLNHGIAEGRGY